MANERTKGMDTKKGISPEDQSPEKQSFSGGSPDSGISVGFSRDFIQENEDKVLEAAQGIQMLFQENLLDEVIL